MTLTITSTLSPRGNELAEAGGMRKKFGPILKDSYDPDTNPGGIVNIGVAENVDHSQTPMLEEDADL